VQTRFVSCRNVTGFAITLAVTRGVVGWEGVGTAFLGSAEFNDASVYNVRKLRFQANL